MAVLVTGGAGFIGSHMALALVDRGEKVVVLDNFATGVRACVPAGVHLIEGDVGDSSLVSELMRDMRIDSVAHFAGSTVVPDSVSDPLGYYKNNTANTLTLAECALAGNVGALLFSSTAAVYGPTQDELVREGAPLAPVSPYGASKLMSERILLDTNAATHLPVAILRYFNVAGADPDRRSGQSTPRATHLIKICIEAALGLRQRVHIFGEDYPTPDGTGVRDYIHVSDLIAAHLAALDKLRTGSPVLIYNCGYGRGYSVREVISAVERISGTPLDVVVAPRRSGDTARVVSDASAIRNDLGWTPRYDDLDAIITHALAWERSQL
jgi:UDP-glucose 4-epimerase